MTELHDFARNELFLASVVPGSKTRITQRQHLEQIDKSEGTVSPELERSGRRPAVLGYIWDWFVRDLIWSSPLTWQELEAWGRLTLKNATAFEFEQLFALDKINRTL